MHDELIEVSVMKVFCKVMITITKSEKCIDDSPLFVHALSCTPPHRNPPLVKVHPQGGIIERLLLRLRELAQRLNLLLNLVSGLWVDKRRHRAERAPWDDAICQVPLVVHVIHWTNAQIGRSAAIVFIRFRGFARSSEGCGEKRLARVPFCIVALDDNADGFFRAEHVEVGYLILRLAHRRVMGYRDFHCR